MERKEGKEEEKKEKEEGRREEKNPGLEHLLCLEHLFGYLYGIVWKLWYWKYLFKLG